jgi:hypothetical protein
MYAMYYASMLRCWQPIRILIRTNHPYLRVGCHNGTNIFIDPPLEVQLWNKWKYMINVHSQPINSFILKNLCQVKQETHMNKEKLNIKLVHHLWLDLDQGRIDQMLSLSIEYPWKQLDHNKKVFQEWVYGRHEVLCDTRWQLKKNCLEVFLLSKFAWVTNCLDWLYRLHE